MRVHRFFPAFNSFPGSALQFILHLPDVPVNPLDVFLNILLPFPQFIFDVLRSIIGIFPHCIIDVIDDLAPVERMANRRIEIVPARSKFEQLFDAIVRKTDRNTVIRPFYWFPSKPV
ncbi:hypothetical protein EA472_16940 [Natrarchaeobius oligotrophus]|uniref:Uncharacterized protein n=1 Tax=Natrarchaeobius chitinivorans TaxID=1679083 RepID=A0A3N6PJG8_NATCH|nr:hypothetical protein EA472_16940 [Natrarchaeobius chitinivorans]